MLYFIVNLHGGSGKSKKSWEKIESLLKQKYVEYKAFPTENGETATSLAKKISSFDEDEIKLVVAGGDGTINEVLNGITDFNKVKLGVIPTGSANDFARGVGIPKDIEKALSLILNSNEGKKIDLGKVSTEKNEGRLFGISAGLGLDAIVCKKALVSDFKKFLNKLHMGQFVYILYTIQTLFSMTTETFHFSFDGGPEVTFNKLIFVAFMNCKAEGGGVPMAPDAKIDDKKLSVCIAADIKKLEAFCKLIPLTNGKHTKLKGFTIKECSTIDIQVENPVTLHLDGEYGNEVQKIHVECLEQKLQLMI